MARSDIADNLPLIGVGLGLGVLLAMGLSSLSRARAQLPPRAPDAPEPPRVGAVTRISCDEAWLTHQFPMPNGLTISGPNLIDQALRNPLDVELTYAVLWAGNALEAAGCGTWVPALRNIEIYMRQSQARAAAQAQAREAARISEVARQAMLLPRYARFFRSRL